MFIQPPEKLLHQQKGKKNDPRKIPPSLSFVSSLRALSLSLRISPSKVSLSSVSLKCFPLSELPPKKIPYPHQPPLSFSSVTPFLFSRICPSNQICRDSHYPCTTTLPDPLSKALLKTARPPLHAAGFFPSNNSQNDFCLIP